MRTVIFASLLLSSVAFADDLAPRAEPNSPETEQADYWNTRFTAGAVTFVASYGAAAGTAASTDHPGADRLYIPVAGPWLALDSWANPTATDKAMLITDGVFQAAGMVALLDGLIDPTDHTTIKIADTKLHLAPRFDGVGVWAQF